MSDQFSASKLNVDPASLLQHAIEEIEEFVKPDSDALDLQNGKLISTTSSGLPHIISLVRTYIGPIFSAKNRLDQEKKLHLIKQNILNARDVIQSHSPLIEKLNEGDQSQQKLAKRAIDAIQKYNQLISEESESLKNFTFNYLHTLLLADKEISGNEIQIPHKMSIKYDSNAAQRTLNEFSHLFNTEGTKKLSFENSKTKKNEQVMLDIFRMKAIRKVKEHWQQDSISLIVSLIQNTPIKLIENQATELMMMRQVLNIIPGSSVVLTGTFTKPSTEARLMCIPILEDFHISLELIQTGFPYPSQYATWVLGHSLVDAQPLRVEQIPSHSTLQKRKTSIAKKLLLDQQLISKARKLYQINKEFADKHSEALLSHHRALVEALIHASNSSTTKLDEFYHYLKQSSSCFDEISSIQEQIVHHFIEIPANCLQDEWLNGLPHLRQGSSNEKKEAAKQILAHQLSMSLQQFSNKDNPINNFISIVGPILGKASQAIILQTMSEKIGFQPSRLTEFEQMIHVSAFQQLLTFLDDLENETEEPCKLLERLKFETELYQSSSIEEVNTGTWNAPIDMTVALDLYFRSRFETN